MQLTSFACIKPLVFSSCLAFTLAVPGIASAASFSGSFGLDDVKKLFTGKENNADQQRRQAPAQNGAEPGKAQSAESYVKATYGNDFFVSPTWFPGVYTWGPRSENNQRYTSGVRLITEDTSLVANDGVNGWRVLTEGTDRPEPDGERVRQLRAQIAPSLPIASGVHLGPRDKPVVFAIYAGVDCSACVVLERFLAEQEFHYVVFPTSLADEYRSLAVDVWCADNPERRWRELMVERNRIPERSDCGYPNDNIKAMGQAFGTASTPMVVFADGSNARAFMHGAPETVAEKKFWVDNARAVIQRAGNF